MDFARYKEWAAEQVCCDCGAKKADVVEGDVWVTETQCWKCFVANGPPERRGLPGARDLARQAGIISN